MARIVPWAREDSGHAYRRIRIPLRQVQTGGRREASAADWRLRVADITQVLIPGDVTRSAGRPASAVLLNLIRQGRVLIGSRNGATRKAGGKEKPKVKRKKRS